MKKIIGKVEEKHIYPISIASHEYEGKTCWSIYKGNTYMNGVFEKSPTTKEEAIECANRLMSGKNTVVTHGHDRVN